MRNVLSPTVEAIEQYHVGMRRYWHAAAAADAVAEKPLGVVLLGEPIVLARLGGTVVAFDDLCRHMGAALSVGQIVDGCRLRCAYHGWSYDADGRCVDIPARRNLPIPSEARVRRYPTEERYGLIWVNLSGGENGAELPPLPEFPEFGDPSFHMGELRTYPSWTASAPRIILGALDDTHFPWVHPGLLGDPAMPEPPEREVWTDELGTYTRYAILEPRNPTIVPEREGGEAAAEGASTAEAFDECWYTNACTPSTIRLVKTNSAGHYVIFLAALPVSHNESYTFWRVGRNFDLDPARDSEYEAFEDTLRAQDQPVVESQRPWLLPPLNSRLLLYIRPADEPLIAYQKWLEDRGIPSI